MYYVRRHKYPAELANPAKLRQWRNFKGKVPTEGKIEDKTAMEQLKLING